MNRDGVIGINLSITIGVLKKSPLTGAFDINMMSVD